MVGIYRGMKKQIPKDKAIEGWDEYLGSTVHAINTRSAIEAMQSSLMDRMFEALRGEQLQEERILWAKLPRYAAPQLGT